MEMGLAPSPEIEESNLLLPYPPSDLGQVISPLRVVLLPNAGAFVIVRSHIPKITQRHLLHQSVRGKEYKTWSPEIWIQVLIY